MSKCVYHHYVSMLHSCYYNSLSPSVPLVYILDIAVFQAATSNQIADYSFITQPFTLDPNNVILSCATGLGPSGTESNTDLGGWYFNGARIPVGTNCGGPVFEVRGANGRNYPGVINLYLCGTFNTTQEGVYTCIMMNSSMMNQTMRVGVYFSGRSESLDMYPITSLLTIFIFLCSCSNDRSSIIIFCNSCCWCVLHIALYFTRFSPRHIHMEEG